MKTLFFICNLFFLNLTLACDLKNFIEIVHAQHVTIKSILPDQEEQIDALCRSTLKDWKNYLQDYFKKLNSIDPYTYQIEPQTQSNKNATIPNVVAMKLDTNEKTLTIRISRFSFTDQDKNLILKAIENQDKFQNIIIDLTNNGGGTDIDFIWLSSRFLDKGLSLGLFGRNAHRNKEIKVEDDAPRFHSDKKIEIWLNSNSASATELFSNIMKFHGRADLIGINSDRTFGKAIGGSAFSYVLGLGTPNPFEFRYHLSHSFYFSPNGETYAGKGLELDEVRGKVPVGVVRRYQGPMP